jgi:uncharacterized protein with NRDE domain
VANYLAGSMTPQEYVDAIRASAHEYNGFNLVLGDRDTLIWYSNKATPTRATASRWSRRLRIIERPARRAVAESIENQSPIRQPAVPGRTGRRLLRNAVRHHASAGPAPARNRRPLELERVLSAVRIESPSYGTRTSTVVKLYAEAPATLQEMLVH